MATDEEGASLRRFVEHVQALKEQDDGFADEYARIKERGKQYKAEYPATVGALPCNIKKNRYKDILPFDHSRVVLPTIDGVEGSDFINANYLRNPKGECRVIAAQGPLSSTVLDFWRMLWHQNTTVVVMVARVVEMGKKKCEKYWPDDLGAMRYGNITVFSEKVDEAYAPDFVVRTFRVENEEGKSRKLTHFQYLSWPDHGVPDSPTQFMRMLKIVRETVRVKEAPMVVHCSAGCGRTGTLAAIDDVWSQLEGGLLKAQFDIFELVSEFRRFRMSIVQTSDQYFMIFKSILNLIDQFRQGVLSTSGLYAAPASLHTHVAGHSAQSTGESSGGDETGYGGMIAEPLYINMQSLGSEVDKANTLRTLSTLSSVRVDDVIMRSSADDWFDESDGVTADAPGGTTSEEDRSKPLSWSTEQRDIESLRTSIDKFDRIDYDSHTKVGYRLERPIGPRAPNTFVLNNKWFPKDFCTYEARL